MSLNPSKKSTRIMTNGSRFNPLFIGITIIFLLITATNCSTEQENPPQDLSKAERVSIDSLELIVGPTTNQEISSPSYMDILPDGRLAVMDSDQFQALIISNEGKIEKTFGRQGKGPGEFVSPRMINIRDTTINAIDTGLQRVSQYDLDGNFIQNFPLERETMHFGFVTTGEEMEFYSVANGRNGKLVGYHNVATDSSGYFGEAPVENPPPVSDQESFRSNAGNGEIPEAIRNDIMMDFHNGDLFVFLKNLSRLQKYTNGDLIWDKKLWMPANDFHLDRFIENASQSGFGVLHYISDLSATDNHIYLLWNATPEHPQAIVQVDPEGELQTIFELPESNERQSFRNIAVDSNSNRLYLCDSGAAEIYAVELDQFY